MSESRIFEGKTTNEAIEKGLKELRVSRNDVDIKVIENEEKRSFFDILAPRVVKVELTVKENREENKSVPEKKREYKVDEKALENAKNTVNEFLEKFLVATVGKETAYTCNIEENVIKVDIKEEQADFLIGYRGETLNAVQTLLTAIADKEAGEKVRVILDIEGYKAKREKSLEDLAEKLEKTVIKTKKSVTLEPMQAYERKIIHTKLQEHPKVKTVSIGEGTHRKVVVSLK